jgi:hypothetical protein
MKVETKRRRVRYVKHGQRKKLKQMSQTDDGDMRLDSYETTRYGGRRGGGSYISCIFLFFFLFFFVSILYRRYLQSGARLTNTGERRIT